MLNLLRVGTGLALVLAIVCVSLWLDLSKERKQTEGLRAQVAALSRVQGAVLSPQMDVRVEKPAAALNNGEGGSPQAQPVKPVPAASQANVSILNTINSFSSERDMMKDPEYRKARLTQARMGLKRTYSGLAEDVGLSDREQEQLLDLLAEREVGIGDISIEYGPNVQPDREAIDEIRRVQVESRRKQDEALQALIGPARQQKWQDYQQTLTARSRVTSMTGMLATSGYPLTEAQLKPLTAALIAEEKYVRQEQSTLRQSGPMTPELAAQRQEESVNRQEESNRRYLEAAAAHMSPQQVALVRQTLEQQIAISRANARAQRERAAAGPAVAPAFGPVLIRN